MATKRPQPEQSVPLQLLVPREEAKSKLIERVTKGRVIRQTSVNSSDTLGAAKREYSKWSDYNRELLRQMFTTEEISKEYSFWGVISVPMNPSLAQEIQTFQSNVDDKIHRLESVIDRLEIIPIATSMLISPAGVASRAAGDPSKAFVVHGRDRAVREAVARVLEKLGITPIILDEQASRGKALIEKLEHYSNVDFAVVLLTPDDEGRLRGSSAPLAPRARQDVILELGYFLGHLKRARVCAIYQSDVELPSDYEGVVYVPLDPGGAWKYMLANELEAAGFSIDMNRLK